MVAGPGPGRSGLAQCIRHPCATTAPSLAVDLTGRTALRTPSGRLRLSCCPPVQGLSGRSLAFSAPFPTSFPIPIGSMGSQAPGLLSYSPLQSLVSVRHGVLWPPERSLPPVALAGCVSLLGSLHAMLPRHWCSFLFGVSWASMVASVGTMGLCACVSGF